VVKIDVRSAGDTMFRVTIVEGSSSTTHAVTLEPADLTRLGAGYASPEDFVRACFDFLLARERKESILRSFDVTEIARYFPEFEAEIIRD
jgi:hypothetical protein